MNQTEQTQYEMGKSNGEEFLQWNKTETHREMKKKNRQDDMKQYETEQSRSIWSTMEGNKIEKISIE